MRYNEYFTLVMGDWNAKIGTGEEIAGRVGQYGLGNRNGRGERLIEFAQSNALKIAGSYFKKRDNKRLIWISQMEKRKTR